MQNRKKKSIHFKIIWNASESPISTSAKLALKKIKTQSCGGEKSLLRKLLKLQSNERKWSSSKKIRY